MRYWQLKDDVLSYPFCLLPLKSYMTFQIRRFNRKAKQVTATPLSTVLNPRFVMLVSGVRKLSFRICKNSPFTERRYQVVSILSSYSTDHEFDCRSIILRHTLLSSVPPGISWDSRHTLAHTTTASSHMLHNSSFYLSTLRNQSVNKASVAPEGGQAE
jgi:hypothetical protein